MAEKNTMPPVDTKHEGEMEKPMMPPNGKKRGRGKGKPGGPPMGPPPMGPKTPAKPSHGSFSM